MRRFLAMAMAVLVLVLPTAAGATLTGTSPITVQNGAVSLGGIVDSAHGGTGANNTATSGRFLKGDGTNFVTSSGSASGTGGCTNQFARTLNSDAAPTCASVALATDVTGTLAVANGGTNLTAANDDEVMVGNGTTWQSKALTNCPSGGVSYTASSNTFGCNAISGAITPILSFGTGANVTAGTTVYSALGAGVGATQARGQDIAPVTLSLDDLRCVADVAPGTGETITVTMASGTCTSTLSDSTGQICTISGTNRTCAEAGAAQSVTQGQCYSWSFAYSGGAATSAVSCGADRTS